MGKIEHALHINGDHYIYFYDDDGFIIGIYSSFNARMSERSSYCRKHKNDIVKYLNNIGFINFEYKTRYGQIISLNEI